jgi:hypothetical protein
MALAMCQAEGPRPEEAPKSLAKAMDVALSAGLTGLKVNPAGPALRRQQQGDSHKQLCCNILPLHSHHACMWQTVDY